jgi:hypothetical protein
MTNDSTAIVQRLWNYCTVLRDDGLFYADYARIPMPQPFAFPAGLG